MKRGRGLNLCLLLHIWNKHIIISHVFNIRHVSFFVCFPQCMVNVASYFILLFTYFHVLLLFMVVKAHQINLKSLWHPPDNFFVVFACYILFFLYSHSTFSGQLNFVFLCLKKFAHLLRYFKCLLGVMRKLGSWESPLSPNFDYIRLL